jgi:hypothetical protein
LITVFSDCKSLVAQSDFYAIENIPEIRLYFSQANWDEILDSLYVEGELARLGGNVIIDGVLYEDVGVRYKGFSSYSSSRDKNPLNIDLDYVYDQNHLGYKKIKLSNVIQDPSFVREVLSYEIARKYMPASKANYANVYINDVLIGLYTNVEAVDNDFLEGHFGTGDNTFFKCNPETLDLNGENANLGNTPGTDISNYYPFYKLKSDEDEGWNELYEFIDVLNDAPENVKDVLNIDRTLWMHAFNYAVINFDSYIGYAQNYYIYKGNDGRFNPILWDLNMSFASYRLTDASDHWDGFTISEAKTIDPLQHLNSFSVQPRPLIRNLLTDETQKRMYLAHLRTIMEENFNNLDYGTRAQYLQNLIDASVQADTNKFYSYTDFTDNLNSTVSDLVDYPGITDLMNDRATYLSTYPGIQGAPDINTVTVAPLNTSAGDNISITADVTGSPINVFLAYRYTTDDTFTMVSMLDDGTQDDGASGDGTYGFQIDNIANKIQYYIYAENDTVGRFSPERAAYDFYELNSKIGENDLVINEVMANNVLTVADQDDEFEDWIELYNNSSYDISTDGMFLSDDASDIGKWTMPSTIIEPGEYFTIWADGDTMQTGNHANFEFNGEGDSLWISYSDGSIIDSVYFGEQQTISSFGRYPNGTGSFVEMLPTFGKENDGVDASVLLEDVFVYPNPADGELNVRINQSESCEIAIYTLDGRMAAPKQKSVGGETIAINTFSFSRGIYLLHVSYGSENTIKKIMITH